MKVLIVTSYDVGGACLAAIRLHMGLMQIGVQSRLLTLHRSSDAIPEHFQWQPSTTTTGRFILKLKKYRLHQLHQKFKPGRNISGEFSIIQTPYDITQSPHFYWADVVNLHWVNEFVDAALLFSKSGSKPMIWTLHDMQAFTGGCHYSLGCTQFKNACMPCHFIEQSNMPALAQKSLEQKIKALNIYKPKLWITAPSAWLTQLSKQSTLFQQLPHTTVANGLNINIYRPIDKTIARSILNLPTDKKIILGVSQSLHDHRKGFKLLIEALPHLEQPEQIVLALVGKAKSKFDAPPQMAIEYLGSIGDERMMALAYNAADAVVIPSIEDNLPNVAIEALCCGIPVVGFHIGGMPEMIASGENGLLCHHTLSHELATTINQMLWHITLSKDKNTIAEEARAKYSWTVQAQNFLKLFQAICA